jgi:PAS domain S-box-containing protein
MKVLSSQDRYPNSPDFLEKIFNSTYHGIAILDMCGNWLKVNDSLCHLFGYDRAELLAMDLQKIIYKEDVLVHKYKYNKLKEGIINQYRVKQRYVHREGTVIQLLVSVSLIKDTTQAPKYIIWQFNNVTKQEAYNDNLRVTLNLAKKQNEQLNAFADIITHNLRSHSSNLSTLVGFLEEDFRWLLTNESYMLLKRAIGNLEETVSHLTEVAKIKQVESNQIKILNANSYAEKGVFNVAALAKQANVGISNCVDSNLHIAAIPAYLDSIILNLLTNAIKYRSHKRKPLIKLTASVENDFLVLKVSDNGLGIDLEKFGDEIFKMYKTFHHNEDATGIGLFITKNQIESMGGRITVKSSVGVGTEFSVFFKYIPVSEIGEPHC